MIQQENPDYDEIQKQLSIELTEADMENEDHDIILQEYHSDNELNYNCDIRYSKCFRYIPANSIVLSMTYLLSVI